MARAALTWLANLDVSTLSRTEQADCLRELELIGSAHLAARSRLLAGFDRVNGYTDDGHGSARSWLRWQTRVTSRTAADALAWTRRLNRHQAIAEALAAGELSGSWARTICDWTERLPENTSEDADRLLVAAAAAGAELADLGSLAEEMWRRTAAADSDGSDDGYEDRSVRLDIHFRGAGKLDGALTPRCAAALAAVLDALGKKAGPEDTRTATQRRHDALEEACRRLISSKCLPDRAGQPTQIQLTMTLDQLAELHRDRTEPDPSQSSNPDTTPNPNLGPGPSTTAMPGDECDASIAPLVIGHVDHDLLDRLAAAFVAREPGDDGNRGRRAWRELALGRAIALLSGPFGVTAYLRGSVLSGPAASISLPLDVGAATETIPPHLRRAVIQRDRHCRFPGCMQPPAACQVHHLVPRSRGGPTALTNLVLLCAFHHLTAVHLWGWRLSLTADGTISATSPDRSRVLRR